MTARLRKMLGTDQIGNTALHLLSSSLVPTTYSNYDSGMRQFAAFCHEENIHPLQATTLSVVRYTAYKGPSPLHRYNNTTRPSTSFSATTSSSQSQLVNFWPTLDADSRCSNCVYMKRTRASRYQPLSHSRYSPLPPNSAHTSSGRLLHATLSRNFERYWQSAQIMRFSAEPNRRTGFNTRARSRPAIQTNLAIHPQG
jgi:hypothetical protein